MLRSPHRVVATLATLSLLVHLAVARFGPYELHRDELLYAAMGTHLKLWAMDFPPFIAIGANVSRTLWGDHVWAMRVLPALASAALIWLAVDATRRLGGTPTAQWLAGIAVLANPVYLRAGALFQPVVFDQLWWSLGLYALLRRALDDAPAWWALVGVAFGLGLLTKFSIVFIGVGTLCGVLISSRRRDLLTPWPWGALLVTIALGSPSIAGQIALDWPVLGQMRDLSNTQLQHVTPGDFALEQLAHGPVIALAALGAWRLIRDRAASGVRIVGVAAGTAFGVVLALHGKGYYVAPIYPLLFAAGASWCSQRGERWFGPRGRWGVRGIAGLQVAGALLVLPLGLPLLPPPLMAAYVASTGIGAESNRGESLPIPQDYADMLGWRESVEAVAAVVETLRPDERADVVIAASNYGQAGALDWYGPALGLPRPIAPIGSFWYFGPGEKPGRVLVKLGGSAASLTPFYRDVRDVGGYQNRWRVPEERAVRVWVARDLIVPIPQWWPDFRGRN